MADTIEFENDTELTLKSLEGKIRQNQQSLDTIPVDPKKYTVLSQSEVSYQGKLYQLIYKVTKPNADQVVTKLSLVDSSIANDPHFADKITRRSPGAPLNTWSDDDSQLSKDEAAFRYLNIDLSKDPIELRSNMEVVESLRGKGLGKLLFQATEALATDAANRTSAANGKQLKLLIRDNSDPAGWTSTMALKGGYQKLSSLESGSAFPTFQKIISR
jgi:hypothetical protein